MELKRDLQLSILHELKSCYPKTMKLNSLSCYNKTEFTVDDNPVNNNAIYLKEHGLIEGDVQVSSRSQSHSQILITAKITANGLDFLEDDGGIRAILNKITIQFDPKDLQTLIKSRLDRENITPEKKNEILSTIKSLPSEGIKNVYKHLINFGLEKAPDVFHLLQNILNQTP
jgi:hypothetical protein